MKSLKNYIQEKLIIKKSTTKKNKSTNYKYFPKSKYELKNMDTSKENIKIAIVIGPEGGLEESDVMFLKEAGAKIITLGERILRTETVALNMISIIMYELEK